VVDAGNGRGDAAACLSDEAGLRPEESLAFTPHAWRRIVGHYARPDSRRGIVQLLSTFIPLLALLALTACAVDRGIWLGLVLSVPVAGLLVRLFMIQHDCGHGAFFTRRWANDSLGRLIGTLTLTPYAFWRRRHAMHHATAGNLDRRGVGDITTLTRRDYVATSSWRRALYRVYRHPLVMFGIGPIYMFWIRHRIPTGNPRREWRSWVSVLGTNIAIAAVTVSLLEAGLGALLLAYVPALLMAGAIGVWLFYVQHQFEHTYWESSADWDFHSAALAGCSFYDLPRPLQWLTCDIGLHHIHHLSSRIPNYRLRDCFEENPMLQRVKRLGLRESLRCARLAIWDEDSRRLVAFRDVWRGRASAAASR